MSDLFVDLFVACSIFFIRACMTCPSYQDTEFAFSCPPWPKANAVNHALLEAALAQGHIPTLESLRSPHRERDGADRNGMTASKELRYGLLRAMMLSRTPISFPIW